MRAAVIGATGSTGALVVDRLLAEGHEVVAIARSPVPPRGPAARLIVRQGDPTDAAFLADTLGGCDAVISCLGQNRKSKSLFAARTSPPDLLRTVARATLRALGSSQAHYVYLSAFGVGEDMARHAWLFRLILRLSPVRDAYLDHAEAERAIRASGTRWTIVKPPGLTDADREVALVDKSTHWSSFETVSRRSLAACLVACAQDASTAGRSMTVGEPG